MTWAAKWPQDGNRKPHLMSMTRHGIPVLFRTKRACLSWIKTQRAYVGHESTNWRNPIPVKIKITEVK